MILLDTHVVLWLLIDPERLSRKAEAAIRNARREAGLAICPITLFEIAHLLQRSRLKVDGEAIDFLEEVGRRFVPRPMTAGIAMAASRFTDPYPKDPADRLIGATALVNQIPLVTADERIRSACQVKTIW